MGMYGNIVKELGEGLLLSCPWLGNKLHKGQQLMWG